MTQEQVKFLPDGNNHQFLSFCLNGHVQLCDNLNSTLTQASKKSIQALYRNFTRDNPNVMVTFLLVQKQQDTHNYGLFTVAFAAEILDGKSPIDAVFHVPQLLNHLLNCLALREKCPYSELFWSLFFRIRTEYGPEQLRIRTLFIQCRKWIFDTFSRDLNQKRK